MRYSAPMDGVLCSVSETGKKSGRCRAFFICEKIRHIIYVTIEKRRKRRRQNNETYF